VKLFNQQRWLKSKFLLIAILSILVVMGSLPAWAVVVTTTADSGAGSLREAIMTANGDGVATPITFDPAVFPGTITLATQLPPLTDPGDTIDGSGNKVTLDGSALPADFNIGLLVIASNITIRGLTIEGFSGHGIQIDPGVSGATLTGVVVSKNVIRRNGGDGVLVIGGEGPENTVGVTIVNNKFEENEAGITVSGSTGSIGGNTLAVVIDSNKIKKSSGDGIRVVGDGGEGSNNIVSATISNNDVKDSDDDGIEVAGAKENASGNYVAAKITHNNVSNNSDNGIVVRGGSDVDGGSTNNVVSFVVGNNKSTRNDGEGILVDAGRGSSQNATGTIAKNKVKDSGKRGIVLRGRSNNSLHNIAILENKVSGSGQVVNDSAGIRILIDSSEVNALIHNITLKGNESHNNRDGINVFRGSTEGNEIFVTGITDNKTNKNGRDGIRIGTRSRKINGSGATPISANRADKNGDDGIDINGVGYVVLANEAKNNFRRGIKADDNVDGGGNTSTGNVDASCDPVGCF